MGADAAAAIIQSGLEMQGDAGVGFIIYCSVALIHARSCMWISPKHSLTIEFLAYRIVSLFDKLTLGVRVYFLGNPTSLISQPID